MICIVIDFVFLAAKRSTISANKEVILSAGSIGTPQILMLSGIGDQTALKKLGIKPILNLPDVGQNLQDHPIMSNYFLVNSNNTFDDVLRNVNILDADLAQWTKNRTGLFGNAPGNAVAFLRLANNAAIFKQFKDPSAGQLLASLVTSQRSDTRKGPQSAHFEFIFAVSDCRLNIKVEFRAYPFIIRMGSQQQSKHNLQRDTS